MRDRQDDAIIQGDEQEENRTVDTPRRSQEGRTRVGRGAQAQGRDSKAKKQDEAEVELADLLALLNPPFQELTPFRLWSLWDMLSNYAHAFCKAMDALTKLAQQLRSRKQLLTAEDARRHACELRLLKGQCEYLGLETSVDKIGRIDTLSAANMARDLEELIHICIAELRSRRFLYVEPSRANEYYASLSEWATSIGGPAIAAVPDGEKASQCYALGMPTACVFHLMRVMEVLTKLLAGRLGVSLTTKAGREKTWGNLATEMQQKVNAFDPTAVARERRAFYNTAVAHLSAVNIAWRTDTMHSYPSAFAKEYSDSEAFDILRNVKTFGKHFCSGYDKYV